MTPARKQRLKEACVWYKEQGFTNDSHIIKAYRQRFSVDKICAMRELVMLGQLPEEKQKAYKEQLAARDQKNAEKRKRKAETMDNPFQDENFFFIAGYTPGGAPYGVTWEEARRDGLVEE